MAKTVLQYRACLGDSDSFLGHHAGVVESFEICGIFAWD
jgi:hypothetical protein